MDWIPPREFFQIFLPTTTLHCEQSVSTALTLQGTSQHHLARLSEEGVLELSWAIRWNVAGEEDRGGAHLSARGYDWLKGSSPNDEVNTPSVPSNHCVGISSVLPPINSTPHFAYRPVKIGSKTLGAARDFREGWFILWVVEATLPGRMGGGPEDQ